MNFHFGQVVRPWVIPSDHINRGARTSVVILPQPGQIIRAIAPGETDEDGKNGCSPSPRSDLISQMIYKPLQVGLARSAIFRMSQFFIRPRRQPTAVAASMANLSGALKAEEVHRWRRHRCLIRPESQFGKGCLATFWQPCVRLD